MGDAESNRFNPPPAGADWRENMAVAVDHVNAVHARKLMDAFKSYGVAGHAELRVVNKPVGGYRIWTAPEHRLCAVFSTRYSNPTLTPA